MKLNVKLADLVRASAVGGDVGGHLWALASILDSNAMFLSAPRDIAILSPFSFDFPAPMGSSRVLYTEDGYQAFANRYASTIP